MMVKPRGAFLARHSIAAALLWWSNQYLEQWYLYRHTEDTFVFFAIWGTALLIAAGDRVLPAVRSLTAARKAVLALILVLSLPWGEWLQLSYLVYADWMRQIFHQSLWIYAVLFTLQLFPSLQDFLAARFRLAIRALQSLPRAALVLPAVFFAGTSILATIVYREIPLIQDSASYLFQARIFLSGHLAAPMPPVPDFFSFVGDNVVMTNGKWFSMYQPGYPALLALFAAVRLEWFLSPLLGALTLYMWTAYAWKYHGAAAAVITSILLFLSPFYYIMSAAVMAHPPELFLVSAILILCRLETEKPSLSRSVLLCLCLFLAMIVRGFSILAFSWPFLLYTAWTGMRGRKLAAPVAMCVGVVAGVLAVGFYQSNTTGNPATPGYDFEFEIPVAFGFGPAIYGLEHTPVRGVENVSNNLLGTNKWLNGFPSGSLFFFFGFLLFAPKLDRWDRMLSVSAASLMLLYYFMSFQDLVYGPRYYYLLCPLLILFIARTADPDSKAPSWFPVLLVIMTAVSILRIPEHIATFDPSRFQAAYLKDEIRKSGGTKQLVFIDPHIAQHLVNWNDPFLRSNVILVRDLGKRNPEAIRAFPEHTPVYFRQVTDVQQTQLKSGFYFLPDPDPRIPGYVSMFDLAMALQAGAMYSDKDCFDIIYSDIFTQPDAAASLLYLRKLEQDPSPEKEYQAGFRRGLRHAARLALLPKLAFEERRFEWHRGFDHEDFRKELLASQQWMKTAGDSGKSILEQLRKLELRIDQDEDGVLSDREITQFLSKKVLLLL